MTTMLRVGSQKGMDVMRWSDELKCTNKRRNKKYNVNQLKRNSDIHYARLIVS